VFGWDDYTLFRPTPGVLMSKIDAAAGFPLSHHISAFGTSGMTAYAGLFELCKPARGGDGVRVRGVGLRRPVRQVRRVLRRWLCRDPSQGAPSHTFTSVSFLFCQ
jgi:hypothetical protein